MSEEYDLKQPLNNQNPDTIIDPSMSAVHAKNKEEDYNRDCSDEENDRITLTPVMPHISQPLTCYPYEGYSTSQQKLLQNYYSSEVMSQQQRVNVLMDSFPVNYSRVWPIGMGHNEIEGGEYLIQSYGVVGTHAMMTPAMTVIYNQNELSHPQQLSLLQLSTPTTLSTPTVQPKSTSLPLASSQSMKTTKNKNKGKRSERTKVNGVSGDSSGTVPKVRRVKKERSLYICGICSKGFKDKYSLNLHIRIHTGEKPFSCPRCARKFRQKPHLAKHYRMHVKEAAILAACDVPVKKTSQIMTPAIATNNNQQCIDEKTEIVK